MASRSVFFANMLLADRYRHVCGSVVECGVWRGGMCAGIAATLGSNRNYYLFDSFEGLPPPTEYDGPAARAWQADKQSPTYYNNCSAEVAYAEQAMRLSGATNFELIKGWFETTLPQFTPKEPIAILRLDGDWYESTIFALRALWKHMNPNGIVIIDDYFAWDGCSRAVHDFLSETKSRARLTQRFGVCYLELHN
jgi:O-methyltransferase